MKKIIISFVSMFILFGMCLSFSFAQPPTFTFTILYSNDFHGADMNLLAKRATVIKQIRKENRQPLLLVDEGDIFGRGRYAKRFYGELEFAVLNELQYDAIVLGNNEFKATADLSAQKILLARIQQARFPVLCGNVIDENTNTYLQYVKPYIIKEFNGVKIGILGLTTPKINFYRQTKGWHCLDPITKGKILMKELDSQVDITIALTHIGFDLDRVLAEKVSGLGAIIGGDSHTVLLNPLFINGIPIVQAGNYGHYLGKLDLTFGKTGSTWILREANGCLIKLDGEKIPPDPAIQKVINGYLNRPHKAA